MIANLPVLQVLIPLGCAPLCVLLRRRSLAWLVFLMAALGSLACAAVLARQVAAHGPLHYAVGGWAPPYGIEFVVAGYNTPVLLVVSGAAVAAAVYSLGSVRTEIDDRRAPLLYTFLCLTLGGLLGLTVTGDVFNAFVFLEISSLSTYAMVALGPRRRALPAAFRYLVIGTVGATFVLIGIGLAYAVTGTLNMADLAARLAAADSDRALYAAAVFVFVGLAVKAAVFPLHAWLPGAYGEAPSTVSTFLAATSTKVALYVLCRLTFTVFGAGLVFGTMPVGRIGLLAGGLAAVAASAVACFQTDLKYLLAWSSIAQIGYILAGISLGTAAGVSAAYLHLINHAVIKASLFAAAGLVLVRLGSVQLSALAGLGRRMPWTFAAIVIAGLGLVGVPPTAGFAGKWALASALIEAGQWPVLVAMLVSSLLALGYIGRIVETAWFREPASVAEPSGAPASMTAVVWVLVAVSVVFGLDAALPASLAESAAEALLNGGG
ncbi:monovalent cation/H+ antiporter subunit D family protein [Nonomuraea longispora]|uniref:Monovalent cation/H+ antiporter subunit D family protein n=1 Tax=Nonomuraea longispora TaxID=1848320 RepID=A0A4R4N7P4_9ACTN|nr:proton-conducting transporter membrane subunit [Nonomuraea longispora]TDC04064.1 monovalent cation/H+ antiporter subunit D family protein [Nonomuraea longispora]